MESRKSFLLRVDARLLDELRRLADDELRSLNGEIEYLLRDALRRRGRLDVEIRLRSGQDGAA